MIKKIVFQELTITHENQRAIKLWDRLPTWIMNNEMLPW